MLPPMAPSALQGQKNLAFLLGGSKKGKGKGKGKSSEAKAMLEPQSDDEAAAGDSDADPEGDGKDDDDDDDEYNRVLDDEDNDDDNDRQHPADAIGSCGEQQCPCSQLSKQQIMCQAGPDPPSHRLLVFIERSQRSIRRSNLVQKKQMRLMEARLNERFDEQEARLGRIEELLARCLGSKVPDQQPTMTVAEARIALDLAWDAHWSDVQQLKNAAVNHKDALQVVMFASVRENTGQWCSRSLSGVFEDAKLCNFFSSKAPGLNIVGRHAFSYGVKFDQFPEVVTAVLMKVGKMVRKKDANVKPSHRSTVVNFLKKRRVQRTCLAKGTVALRMRDCTCCHLVFVDGDLGLGVIKEVIPADPSEHTDLKRAEFVTKWKGKVVEAHERMLARPFPEKPSTGDVVVALKKIRKAAQPTAIRNQIDDMLEGFLLQHPMHGTPRSPPPPLAPSDSDDAERDDKDDVHGSGLPLLPSSSRGSADEA